MKLLLTNDDGVDSPGLRALAIALHEQRNCINVVAPEVQRSSIGSARTYDKPLRLVHRSLGYSMDGVYTVDGTPADAVFIGVNKFKPDIVISGINLGENVGLESLFISGTIGAAIQASLMGVPAIAVSVVVPQDKKFINSGIPIEYFKIPSLVTATIIQSIEETGWFSGIDVISINSPDPSAWSGEAVISDMLSRKLFREELMEARDPRGSPIYWRWGHELEELDPNSDAYWLYKRNALVITPISLMREKKDMDLPRLFEALNKVSGKVINAINY
ncbi:MAG: 5'/3'-nucleotidase SurE [Thermocladium sp.]|jgi:5''/3''-nucleotidase SurE